MKKKRDPKIGERVIFKGFPKYRCYAEVRKVLGNGFVCLVGMDNKGGMFVFDNTDEWEFEG